MDVLYVALVVGGFAAFLGWAIAYSRKHDNAILAHLAPRGFVREPEPPSFRLESVRFEPRVAFRGPACVLVLGRGFGPRISDQPPTSTGHLFYLCAVLPGERDERWRARFDGDARAVLTGDGRTVVYWQLRGTSENVDRALRELETP